MLKVKIKDFKINTLDKTGIDVKLPCSLSMALESLDISPLAADSYAQAVEFVGAVEVEPHVLAMKHICLRLAGISEPAEVMLNGKVVSAPDSRERIYVYNVKDRLLPGYNTITIRFTRDNRASRLSGIRLRRGEIFDPAIESAMLLAFNSAAISSVNVSQTHSERGVTLNVTMGIIGDKTDVRAVATLVSPSGKIYYGSITDGKGSIMISDPLMWWPVGLGVPNVYDLNVNLYYGDSAEDVYEVCVGLRQLTLGYENGDICARIGSLPVFLRGMQIVPERCGASFMDKQRAEMLVSAAAEAGINAFYVSSFGRAPDDYFLNFCDKHGIIVILGIGDRLATAEQVDDAMKREIADCPRRISHHASLAGFYIDRTSTPRADALAEILSAYCFDVSVVISDGEPITELPISVPEMRTLSTFARDKEANVLSREAELRTDPADGFADMLVGMAAEYRFPNGTEELSYLSELAALDRLETAYTEARFRGKPSFFASRLNDSMPMLSPSVIDYFGRRTAVYYGIRRLYSPITVLCRSEGYKVRFAVFNDSAKDYSGSLTYRILDTDNREMYRGTVECEMLRSMQNRPLGEIDLTEYVKGYETERYLVYSYSDGVKIREGVVFFVKKKHFSYKPRDFRTSITGSGKKFDLTIYPGGFVSRLKLGFAKENAVFSENYIDITDASPRRISLESEEIVSPERLESELTLMSLGDVGAL